MLPLFKKELVFKHHWLTEDELMDIISISQSVPGSLTINSAAFLGRTMAGIKGAVFAILGAALAPMLCIALFVGIQPLIDGNVYVDRFFTGIRAAVAGLILSALFDLRRHVLQSKADLVIMAGSFAAIQVFDINFIYIIACGILCSLFLYFLANKNKIGTAVILGSNLAISAINYRTAYVFWAIFGLAYICYQYDKYLIRKRIGNESNDKKDTAVKAEKTEKRRRSESKSTKNYELKGEEANANT